MTPSASCGRSLLCILCGVLAALAVATSAAAVPSLAASARPAQTEYRGVVTPVRLGAPRGLRERRFCPHGPCEGVGLVRPDGSADVTDSSPPFWLTPPELHVFYQLPPESVASTPPTIAVIEAGDDPTAESDLNTYSQEWGLPSCTSISIPQCFFKYNGSGIPYTPGLSPVSYNEGWSYETTLDLEAIHATCENCRLMLVEVKESSTPPGKEAEEDAGAAVAWAAHNGGPGDSGAAVISNSYANGFVPSTSESAFTDYDQPGHVVVASSGDEGLQTGFAAYPASNPNVVAVGGTTLSANADGTYGGESVWDNSQGAAGSACDLSGYLAPPWQASDPNFAAEGCMIGPTGYRTIADVSADADPGTGLEIYQSFSPGGSARLVAGGTSLSAPIIAGVYGLAGGYPTQPPPGGCPSGTSCAGYAPYADQGAAVPALHDVTTGYNVSSPSSCSSTICQAGVGLDGPTGVGTPIGIGAFGGPSRPNAITDEAGAITPYAASLRATVDPRGQSGTTAKLCFGVENAGSYCSAEQPVNGTAQTLSVSTATVTALTPATTYRYVVIASGPGGLGVGTEATFTTLPEPPQVETQPASSVAQTTATLNATVDAEGGALSACEFEYGLTASYGSRAACSPQPGPGSSPLAVSAVLTGLSANTTYHFRIAASDTYETSYGADHTFTTAASTKPEEEAAAAKKHAEEAAAKTKAEVAAGGASVKIEKMKLTASGLLVTIMTSRAGTVAITGPGLKKTIKTLGAGTHQVRVAYTKAGKTARAHHKKIKVVASLKAGGATASSSKQIRL